MSDGGTLAATAGQEDLAAAALSVVLAHYYSDGEAGLAELGRISSCSKSLRASSEAAWRGIFAEASGVASGPCSECELV